MRMLLCVAAVVTSAAGAAHAADYPTTVLSESPVAYFRLTDPATGSSVGGYTTTYSATTGTGPGAPLAADPGNTGATFAGSNAAPSAVRTSLAGGVEGTGSINVWINLRALPSTLGQIEYIAGESQSGNDLDLQINTDNQLAVYTGAGENTSVAYGASNLGAWHMITATYDGTVANGYRDIYIDGALAASYAGAVNGAAKTNPFNIGYSDVFTGRDFSGSIDEVSVYNYGLSAGQVQALFASAATPAATGASPAPEPTSWALMLTGFGLVGGALRNSKRRLSPTFA